MTSGQVFGLRLRYENAPVLHPLDRLLDQLDPLPVTRRQRLARSLVRFDKLSRERVVGGRSHIADAPQVAQVRSDPLFEVVKCIQPAKLWLAMKVKDHVDLATNYRPDQRLLIDEVVRQLRTADRGRLTHLLQVESGDSVDEDHLCRRLQYPLAGGSPLCREWLRVGKVCGGH